MLQYILACVSHRLEHDYTLLSMLQYILACTLKTYLIKPFAKLRKAGINFAVSVRPFVRPAAHMKQLGSHWTDFHAM